MGRYEFFDHEADVGIRIYADSAEDMFLTAAQALMEWMGPPPGGPVMECRVSLEADDPEGLLVRWLQEVLCLFYLARSYFIGAREVRIDLVDRRMEACVFGSAWDETTHGNYQEVKAVTYHQIKVERKNSNWEASVILDI